MKVFSKKAPYCLEHVGERDITYYVRYRKRGVRLDKVRLEAENRVDALEEAEKMILDAKERARERKNRLSASTSPLKLNLMGLGDRALVSGGLRATFKEVATKILAEMEGLVAKRKRSRRTLQQYKLHLEIHLIPWFEQSYPTLDEFMIDPKAAWLQFCEDRWEVDPEFKIYTHRQIARTVMLRAFETGLILRKVKLDCPDGETLAGRWVSDGEVHKLTIAANPIMRLQIQMASDMGMRRWEILRLKKERIQFDRNIVRLEKDDCKIRKAREFKIPMSVLVPLKRHLLSTGDSPYLFPSPIDSSKPVSSHKTAWDTTRKNAGVECRFHDLRHTFITNALLVHDVSIEKVSQYCGVSPEVIERVYLHNRAEFTEEIAAKVDRKKSFQHVLEATEIA